LSLVLVTGATGHIGREVVLQLVAAGAPVRALARTPEEAGLPREVEVVGGDLTKPETLDACLEGVASVFLVWVVPPPTAASVLERIRRHARRVVFLSAPLKTRHPFFQQPNPARAVAEHVESVIEASGLPFTFLRPGIFAASSEGFWAPQIRAGDLVRWPYLETPTAPIDERDVAAVAVRTLREDSHAGAEYVLTGPESLSQRKQIEAIGLALGRSLRIEEIGPDEARRGVLSLMPPSVATMLLDAWAAALGQPAFVTRTVSEITGAPARTFEEWARDHREAFRA
jgi:uncharacterized protein YbjT (DUF2867 family)